MKKKVEKLLKIILICLLIVNIFGIYNNKSYASNVGMADITENLNFWKPISSSRYADRDFNNMVSVIATVVKTIGIFVSLGTLMVIGIKYMLGSVEEKAQYKQRMIPWVVGAIMVFAMSTIPTLLFDVSKNLFN